MEKHRKFRVEIEGWLPEQLTTDDIKNAVTYSLWQLSGRFHKHFPGKQADVTIVEEQDAKPSANPKPH